MGYGDYRDRNHSLLGLAAHGATAVSFSYAGIPERIICDEISDNYFDLLGVQPAAGRLLAEPDDAAAVISYRLWQRRFSGSSGAIGARIDLNGNPFTIVGVTEKGFRGTVLSQPFDLWVPLRTRPRTWSGLSAGVMENRSSGWLYLFGRLKPRQGNAFRNARVSCIAGPCPFTKIESDGFPQTGSTLEVSARNWSDTATFLVEAEVVRPTVSDIVRDSYPVIFGQTLSFTLPADAEGVSIQAEMNGVPIVYPLGPNLFLTWAECNAREDSEHTRVYRCLLKPGYRFP